MSASKQIQGVFSLSHRDHRININKSCFKGLVYGTYINALYLLNFDFKVKYESKMVWIFLFCFLYIDFLRLKAMKFMKN